MMSPGSCILKHVCVTVTSWCVWEPQILCLYCAYESAEISGNAGLDSAGLGQGLRFCVSYEPPGAADTASISMDHPLSTEGLGHWFSALCKPQNHMGSF